MEIEAMKYPEYVRIYAEGRPGQWEAFCLDLDLAVQGTSFPEVKKKIEDQVELFVESLHDLPEADQIRMLNRKVPLWFELRAAWKLLCARWDKSEDRRQRAEFEVPMHGAAAGV